jgi:hypothetical protein
MMRTMLGTERRLNSYTPLPHQTASSLYPSAKRCRSGSPVTTGSQEGFGGRSQPLFALLNNQRMNERRVLIDLAVRVLKLEREVFKDGTAS